MAETDVKNEHTDAAPAELRQDDFLYLDTKTLDGFPGYDNEADLTPPAYAPAKLTSIVGNKDSVVKDSRGVGDLQLVFPHVSTGMLVRLMEDYGSYTTVVDVLRALGKQRNLRTLTAGFWVCEYWPRAGRLPHLCRRA